MSKVAEIFQTMEYGPAPESPSEANAWIESHSAGFKLFINGEWRNASDNAQMETSNPATGAPLGKLAVASKSDVDDAVKAARAAQPAWASLGGHGRARYLYAIARHIQKHGRLFAMIETIDNGKPIRETRDLDIPLVARHFYHHAGWAQLIDSEFPNTQPVGVCGQVIPWNFPLLMMAWKIAPALAAGNTVVLKPAEYTSLTAIRFAELCQEIGLPAGVVNIITGEGATGAEIVNHSDVDKVAFTGSTEVGRIIRRAIAGSGKKLSLELGGKSPYMIFDDADLDSAVEGLVDAIWFNQGQVCCAGSRLLVQESVAQEVYGKIKRRMENLRVGDPTDKAIDIGAIVHPVQHAEISKMVQLGVDEGCEMYQPDCAMPEQGCFFKPTIFTDVSPSATIAMEEIFGPVLVAMPFRTPAEGVALANNTRYGLAASVWTDNINLALDIAPKLVAGSVWVNGTNFFDAASGFGGYRESGFGREGGREGMWEYLKYSWDKLASPAIPAKRPTANGKSLAASDGPLSVDRTAKMYVGGKQARPDGNYSTNVLTPDGTLISEVGKGNRKDIRNAVEAARKAQSGWGNASGHLKAQILYYIAENLGARAAEFADRISLQTSASEADAKREVELSIERLYACASWADKYDGAVHSTPIRNVTAAMNEPIGTLAIACAESPSLLGFIGAIAPAIAMGNTVVVIPSELYPLSATDMYQVFDTSDLPGGVVNIITGEHDELVPVLAKHDNIDGMWHFGSAELSKVIEESAADNMKRTWVSYGKSRDWENHAQIQQFLREATQVKNIWIPYGEQAY